ncbi:serine hydrolase domain-containing protein [Psychrobacillus sp. FSL K6-4046]|uniref:serine hydrolase domain-containing protein n=1 Tax=Psychrobacillus sp. FSL K6-4046 TaxID=2921550 RepID=UPI00315B2B43
MKTINTKLEEIDALINGVIEEQGVGISVSIVKNGKLIFAKGYGYAQLEPTPKLIDENTYMSIQSVTKNFVSVCMMKLVEEDLIHLDKPIVHYLPYFRTKEKGSSDHITVRQVLSHTSGFPADLGIANLVAPNVREIYSDTPTEWSEALAHYRLKEEEVTSIHSREDITRWFRKVELDYPPGHTWNYCTDAYVILGDLIEKVTGESWESFLQNRFITPLQMKRTTADVRIIMDDDNYAKYYT